MGKSTDDIYALIQKHMRNIKADVAIIRESCQTVGTELAHLRNEFDRHKSDIHRKITEVNKDLTNIKEFLKIED